MTPCRHLDLSYKRFIKNLFDTIAYGVHWCLFLLFGTPLAVLCLLIRTLVKLVLWCWSGNDRDYCDPAKHPNDRLAVVITGCDSGFGKEIALWAADAGFVVFAGCLKNESMQQFALMPNICSMKMDVTSHQEVSAAAKIVSDWLKHVEDPKKESRSENDGRKRHLHALISNAGMGVGGEIDWIDLAGFQKCIDGMYVHDGELLPFFSSCVQTLTFPDLLYAVNYMGKVRCCKAFLPIFKEQAIKGTYQSARIFNMVSMAGMVSGVTVS